MEETRKIRYHGKHAFIWKRYISKWSGVPVCDHAGWFPINRDLPKERWPPWAGLREVDRVIYSGER